MSNVDAVALFGAACPFSSCRLGWCSPCGKRSASFFSLSFAGPLRSPSWLVWVFRWLVLLLVLWSPPCLRPNVDEVALPGAACPSSGCRCWFGGVAGWSLPQVSWSTVVKVPCSSFQPRLGQVQTAKIQGFLPSEPQTSSMQTEATIVEGPWSSCRHSRRRRWSGKEALQEGGP